MDGENCWLEGVLLKKSYEESIIKIISFETRDNQLKKGDNYLSKIDKITVKVMLGSGNLKNVQMIVKSVHDSEHVKKFSIDSGVFIREITMYRDILPKMQCLLEEIGDTDEPFWPQCHDVRLYDRLVFEDLSATGYRMVDRTQQMGLEAALLVLKYLGKFHALSRILLTRHEIPAELTRHIWSNNHEQTLKSMDDGVQHLIVLMESWGDEWKDAVKRFKNAKLFGEEYLEALKPGPDDFTVLNHGDCWTNNLMFKYGEGSEHPHSVKFVDMQICFVSTPLRDISYFLSTSVRQQVRENHEDQLLLAYCDSLKTCLSKFGYAGDVPDVDCIKRLILKGAMMPLLDSFMIVPVALRGPDDTFELIAPEENAENNVDATQNNNPLLSISATVESIIKSAVKKALELNIV